MLKWSLVFFVSTFLLVSGQQKGSKMGCEDLQSCELCLRNSECQWCTSPDQTRKNVPNCAKRDMSQEDIKKWCPEEKHLVNDKTELNIMRDDELSSDKSKDVVQIKPQRMRLRLALGVEQVINVTYQQAEDYPVDLYYLMDLSKSMELHKNTLSTLGVSLAATMQKITGNFKLGFGSFVDKVELPMTSTTPEKLKSPCKKGDKSPCAPPYGYKHQMPLSTNATEFELRVQNAPVSGNLDAPEGGFDAMMQAMVCKDRIGWRTKARHIMVVSTDEGYHMAGDGRLAGIIEPNDGLCHMDADGTYSWSLEQDYPSISQIDKIADRENINIIFAVTEGVVDTYTDLSNRIGGSSIGTLQGDSKNVVELVSSFYESLVNSVTLSDDAPPYVHVKYNSTCKRNVSSGMNTCDDVRVNVPITFNIAIKALKCPENRKDWNTTIVIKPNGLDEELIIDLELICDCKCSNAGNEGFIGNADICRNHGDSVCGVCSCMEGYLGKACECGGSHESMHKTISEEACRPVNSTVLCDNHGKCSCGICVCEPGYTGKFCKCNNNSCKKDKDGQTCGGSKRGECKCGTCKCEPDFEGEACEYKTSEKDCYSSEDNTVLCSGKGECKNRACVCKHPYTGKHCEECPTCRGSRCEEYKDYVECAAFKSGPHFGPDDSKCQKYFSENQIKLMVVDEIKNDTTKNQMVKDCRLPSSTGCTFVFQYRTWAEGEMKKKTNITVLKKQECPEPANILGVALWVVGLTVLLGFLILLIWKILTTLHDKREYAKFEKERAMAKWDRGDNPLYKPSTTNFQNPAYSSKS